MSYNSAIRVAVPGEASKIHGPSPARGLTFAEMNAALTRAASNTATRAPHPLRSDDDFLEEAISSYTWHQTHWSQYGMMTKNDARGFLDTVLRHARVSTARKARRAQTAPPTGPDESEHRPT